MKKTNVFVLLIILFSLLSCGEDEVSVNTIYKQYMRAFVENISNWAKTESPGFIIIPQNGHELSTTNGNEDDPHQTDYIQAIDGAGQEDLFYGYNFDNVATPPAEYNYLLSFLNIYESYGVEVLVTDYCWTLSYVNDSYAQNASRGFISIATTRGLDSIPSNGVYNVNDNDIASLSDAKNFLYLLDPETYSDKDAYITALAGTNYDLLVIDLFFKGTQLNSTDVNNLKTKLNGGARLVICYMSIGEAEDYRYYWQPAWNTDPPSWLCEENPDWEGNYKVEYWDPEWQAIIFGNDSSYLNRIIVAGFDGVYLDIIDAFEYFE